MSYKIRFPTRRLEAVFGTAYPSLSLTDEQKIRIIRDIVASRHGMAIGYGGQLEVDYREYKWFFLSGCDYVFKIGTNNRPGYQKAVDIEKFLYSVRRLSWLSPPRFWNRWFRGRRPSDTFMITGLDTNKVFDWLQAHVTYADYQLYSKFGEDISIGFRNPEYATMFKLTFGDQDI